MSAPRRLTQLQKDVLSLYRRGLRAIRSKPEENKINFHMYLRYAFAHPSQGGGIGKRDFQAVEYMMRRADRMMEQIFEDDTARDMQVTREIIDWYDAQHKPRLLPGRADAGLAPPPPPAASAPAPAASAPGPAAAASRDAPRRTRTALKKK